MEERFISLETRVGSIEEQMSDLKTDTKAILRVVGGASNIGRLIKVHGPRVFAALVGYLIATNRIDAEFAKALHTILFGV